MQPQPDINDVLRVVELSPAVLSFIKLPYKQAVQGLNDFKGFIQKKKKELALRYHPDKGGDEERMKEINHAIDLLMSLEMVQARPVMQYYSVFTYNYTPATSATGSTATGFW